MSTINVSEKGLGTINRLGPVVASALAAVLVLLSFALGRLYVPADASDASQAVTLDFGDFKSMIESGAAPSTGLQEIYFGWLAWVLAILAIGASLLSSALLQRATAIVAVISAVAALLASVFGTKGQLTWAQYIEQGTNLRIGSYFAFLGYFLIIATGVVVARRRGRQ
ncbi:hypothetical protein [Gordonia rubripertincta]|uniref:Uncharacterized protein n=1 Tax=Gordonia rubripertincta TaxID=36822 RepID=A0ABT4MWJ3_GORRU|nr:hypothetical protein [Gordonia rubripertincta]MCZ4551050.1 hypothetical protein [Gordonia rubripertincta]